MHNIKRIINTSIALAKASFKEQNEGSYSGIILQIIVPLLMLGILVLIFSSAIGSQIPHYPFYVLIGIVIFNFFTSTIANSIDAIKINGNLAKNLKFPLVSLIISITFLNLFLHIPSIIVIIIFILVTKSSMLGIIFYPLILLFLTFFTLGIAFTLATMKVYHIDTSTIWSMLSMVWWFATPIFYSVEKSSPIYQANLINPLFYIITTAREIIIYNHAPEPFIILGALFFSLLSLLIGLLIFHKLENKFAEKL
jgi:ABC-type polysaccharide/polyol phosphate export permease